jgi:hypothetical protein
VNTEHATTTTILYYITFWDPKSCTNDLMMFIGICLLLPDFICCRERRGERKKESGRHNKMSKNTFFKALVAVVTHSMLV